STNTSNIDTHIDTNINILPMRKNSILNRISEIVSTSSGIDYQLEHASYSFIELGLDSLALTQLSLKLKKEFNLPITFRQLNEEFASPELLANYIDSISPTEAQYSNGHNNNSVNHDFPKGINRQNESSLEALQKQIQLLSMQINSLQSKNNLDNLSQAS